MTRTQIEKEGWSFKARAIDEWFEKYGEWNMGSWTGRRAVMRYGRDKRLRIYIDDFGVEHTVFEGQCIDVETFRLISKLVLNEE